MVLISNSSPLFFKFLLTFLLIINFVLPLVFTQPGPPSMPSELLISKSLKYIPADNATICNITVVPIDSSGNEIDSIIDVISSLNGSYLLDMSEEWVLQPQRVIYQTTNHMVSICFKSYSTGIANITIMAGNCINYTQIEVINTPFVTVNYTLWGGWNLISLPIINFTTADEFLQSCEYFDTLVRWLESQAYLSHPKGGPNNFDLENGDGYFLYVTNETIYQIKGYLLPNISMNLCQGWNLVGWKRGYNITAEDLANSISYCDCVVKWDNVKQKWIIHPKGGPNNFIVERGMGIFIHLNDDAIWDN